MIGMGNTQQRVLNRHFSPQNVAYAVADLDLSPGDAFT